MGYWIETYLIYGFKLTPEQEKLLRIHCESLNEDNEEQYFCDFSDEYGFKMGSWVDGADARCQSLTFNEYGYEYDVYFGIKVECDKSQIPSILKKEDETTESRWKEYAIPFLKNAGIDANVIGYHVITQTI